MDITLEQIKFLYAKRTHWKVIAQELGISPTTLTRKMKSFGVSFQDLKNEIFNADEIIQTYKDLGSISKTATKLNVPKYYIKLILSNLNIAKSRQKYIHNSNFFSTLNEKSMYWAGFLAADGNVIKPGPNSAVLRLNIVDKDHLEKFQQDLSATNEIKTIRRKTISYSIQIHSMQLCKDLEKFNIKPNKTLSYSFPTWLTNHPLLNHFMRGYFDGDGCISYSKNKKNKTDVKISIVGQDKFLTEYKKIIETKTNHKKLNKLRLASKKNQTVKVLVYGGNNISLKIYEFLYQNAETFLDRKKKKFSILLR